MDTSKEFLTPGSMLTPGFAGGMTMAITNVVSGQFGIAAPGPSYVGLGLSFLFGLLVWASKDTPLLARLVYYVLNSLVIFVVAVGSNTVGGAAASSARQLASFGGEGPRIEGFLISSAVAQPVSDKGWCCVGDEVTALSREVCGKRVGKFFSKEDLARRACATGKSAKEAEKGSGFFRPWVRAGSA